MHIHTMVSSPCSYIDPVECIETAIALGLDGICITEHDALEGSRVVKEIARGYENIVVFSGMEVLSRESHLLVYGHDEDITGVPSARDVIDIAESAGGIVVAAHPWRSPFGWYSGTLDRPLEETDFAELFKVIEKASGSSSVKQNKAAEEYCLKTGVFGIGGSDAHNVGDIGCCVTDFEGGIGDEKDLVAALREGRYKAVMNSRYFEIWGGNNGR
jgi:histidinol phosphatase-like PHP family hydrolase